MDTLATCRLQALVQLTPYYKTMKVKTTTEVIQEEV